VAEVSEDGLKRVREAFTSAGDWWFLWPAVVMAYVLALSALKVFGLDSVLGDDWEDRKRPRAGRPVRTRAENRLEIISEGLPPNEARGWFAGPAPYFVYTPPSELHEPGGA